MKVVATNRKARRDYQILEVYEAGIELKGMEVKSLRTMGCSIDDSFASVEGGEVYLHNMHIPEFTKASYFKLDPKRIRKLLLHKKEIKRLQGLTTQKGLTLIPLKVYFNERGLAKVEMALAKGRKLFDKRKKIKEEIAKREAEHTLKKYYKRY
ncbi:MAG TPA: SsrA-binding protein SmpB [Candidatus Omnitrophica bacterium]|nr:SsrA-binding protein SmpB [Candidatus Omnitrophota bacterium]